LQLTFFALDRAEYTSENITNQSDIAGDTVTQALNNIGAAIGFIPVVEYVKVDAENSTNSTTPQTKIKLTTSNLPLGTYKVDTYIELNSSRTNRSILSEVWLNSDNLNPLTRLEKEVKDTTDYVGYTSFDILENINGINTIEIVFYVEQDNTTANARNAKILIQRIL
jgi:hypothetical protein